jgi:hypothetical protein
VFLAPAGLFWPLIEPFEHLAVCLPQIVGTWHNFPFALAGTTDAIVLIARGVEG